MMNMDTLVLNKDGNPLNVFPLSVLQWQVAMKLQYIGKVTVIKTYDDWTVHSPSSKFYVPSVIITTEYVNLNRKVKYSRNNVYLRDDYTCQLCGDKPRVSELTLDHVIPKSSGGKTNWKNITTACKRCNWGKGSDSSIVPRNMPHRPTYYELAAKRQKRPIVIKDSAWADYLQWKDDLIYVSQENGRPVKLTDINKPPNQSLEMVKNAKLH